MKQVDATRLHDLARYALGAAFPDYGTTEEAGKRATAEVANALGGVTPLFDPAPARRFAGDSTLPRASYYSVAENDRSWDGGTLMRELGAYLIGCEYPGLVSLYDSTLTNNPDLLGILPAIPRKNSRSLDLSVPSFLVALRPLTNDPVLRHAYGKGSQYLVQIPYTISEETIEGILDLRRPAARSWLVDCFNSRIDLGGKQFPILLGRDPLTAFEQLLPTLLDQWLGGAWSTANLTGVFARRAGATGLVYPSARSNSAVHLAEGEVRESSGWCFVRYPKNGRMLIDGAFSLASDEWPTRPGYSPGQGSWVKAFIPIQGTQIEHVTAGPNAGSWEVRGLAEYCDALYRMSQAAGILRGLGERPAEAARQLIYLALASTSENVGYLGAVVTAALLGSAGARERLEAMLEAAPYDLARALTTVIAATSEVRPEFRVPTGSPLAFAWALDA